MAEIPQGVMERARDLALLRTTRVQRVATSISALALDDLVKMDNRITAALRLDLPSVLVGPAPAFSPQWRELWRKILTYMQDGWVDLRIHVLPALEELAVVEVRFWNELYTAISPDLRPLGTVADPQGVVGRGMFQGQNASDWIRKSQEADMKRTRLTLISALTDNLSVEPTIEKVHGSRRMQFSDGILVQGRRAAETLVRTAVTHVSTGVILRLAEHNPDLVPLYQWLSALDSGSTDVCTERAGQVWRPGEGPKPPAHPRCRSTILLVPAGHTPPARTSFAAWFDRLPPQDQADVLGSEMTSHPSRFTGNMMRAMTVVEMASRQEGDLARWGFR